LPLHKDAGSPISPTVIGAVGARSPSASPSDVLLGFWVTCRRTLLQHLCHLVPQILQCPQGFANNDCIEHIT
jgi:hypothetical protein